MPEEFYGVARVFLLIKRTHQHWIAQTVRFITPES